jgi:hypothetical protein
MAHFVVWKLSGGGGICVLSFPPKLCLNSKSDELLPGEGFICVLCEPVAYKKWVAGVYIVSKKLLPL